MELSKEKIDQLIVKYESMGESKANWLLGIDNYKNKAILSVLFENGLKKIHAKSGRLNSDTQIMLIPVIRRLFCDYGKIYNLNSLISILNANKSLFELEFKDSLELEKLDNFIVQINNTVDEDMKLKKQIDLLCN
jgi:hypothetical protein